MKTNLFKQVMGMVIPVLTMISTNVWATEYAEMFTIKSSTVVNNSTYGAYTKTITGVGGDSDTTWVITYGGNNKSVGTNSTNRSSCNLSNSSKYAVDTVTTSHIASAFANTSLINNVSKIKYTINGGSNQTNTNVFLLYSTAGTTFSKMSLTSGSQGAAISSGTEFEFTKCSGYFALLFVATNSSGAWRIDDVDITFYKENVVRTVQWKVQGENYTTGDPSSSVAVGDKVAKLPTAPAGAPTNCGVFLGWTATAIDGSTNTVPSDLFTDAAGAPEAPAGDGAIVYHAVFADIKSVDP